MSAVVYHFTDTGRLPWILRDGVFARMAPALER